MGASAGAQAEGTSAPRAAQLADGVDGLPGLYRVGVPATPAPRGGGGLWLQYGYTEPQDGEADAHHRLGGALTAGGALWPYLAAAVRVDARHDVHGDDAWGADSGTAVDVTPILRAGAEVASGVHLGVEGRLAFAGAAATGGVPPPTFDGRLQAAARFGRETVALYAGYRTAQGGAVIDDAQQLRPGDRVVLGVSEYDALLLGLGFLHSLGRTDLLAEATWDVLLGSGAPDALRSPLRLGGGARHWVASGLALHAQLEVSPGGRAPATTSDPLVPVEPRLLALLGVTVRFPDLIAQVQSAAPPPPAPTPTPEEAPPLPPAPPPAGVRITVRDETGHPISDALVVIEVPASEGRAAKTLEVPLEELNVYAIEGLDAGQVDVTISAELLQPHSQQLLLSAGETAELQVKLAQDVSAGSQLRGLVRDYSGAGVAASIRVLPGDLKVTCSPQGEFVLDVPPGTYDVLITADGYRSQQRRLKVRKEGVTVLNADLQRTK